MRQVCAPSRSRQEVRRIDERLAADDDGLDLSWDGSRDMLDHDWEDGAAEDVADLGTRERESRQGEGRRQEGKKSV